MFPNLRLREFALIPDDTPEPELIVSALPGECRSAEIRLRMLLVGKEWTRMIHIMECDSHSAHRRLQTEKDYPRTSTIRA